MAQPGSPRGVLDQFLTNAALRNEKSIAIVRMVIAGLLLLETLVFGHTLTGRWTIAVTVTLLALAFSIWQWLTLSTDSRMLPRLYASVVVDAILIGSGLLAWVLWPNEDHPGLLYRVEAPLLILAMMAAGFRLSRRVAAVGAGIVFLMGAVLIGLDMAWNVVYPVEDVFIVAALGVGSALMGYFVAARTKQLIYEGVDASLRAERARQRLGIYVSEELAADMLEQAELAMEGVRQPVAILFSDLRGFTKYAENIAPERLVDELNDYLDAMVQVIQAEGGFVDKFIGDAIMAVFSVPTPKEDDALRALRAAAGMQKALETHNQRREAKGLPPLRQGIGVHFGRGVVGNIGTERKAQFTVMGDVVNVASRLESATKKEGVPVLVSADLVDQIRQSSPGSDELSTLEVHGPISVPGREGDLDVWRLCS